MLHKPRDVIISSCSCDYTTTIDIIYVRSSVLNGIKRQYASCCASIQICYLMSYGIFVDTETVEVKQVLIQHS